MKTIATVKTEGLHLRVRADADSKSVDELARGDELEITDQTKDGNWLWGAVTKIQSGKYTKTRVGQTGWVHHSGVHVRAVSTVLETEPNPFAWVFTWQTGATVFAILFVITMLLLR